MAIRASFTHRTVKKIRRKGVHAKTKMATNNKSRHYKKRYRGQGRV